MGLEQITHVKFVEYSIDADRDWVAANRFRIAIEGARQIKLDVRAMAEIEALQVIKEDAELVKAASPISFYILVFRSLLVSYGKKIPPCEFFQ